MEATRTPGEVARLMAPLPDPKPGESSPVRPDSVKVTASIKSLLWEASFLRLHAEQGDRMKFAGQYATLLTGITSLQPDVQALRYEWARERINRLGLDVCNADFGGGHRRNISSAHLACYELCRLVLYTAYAAIGPQEILDNWPSRPEFSAEQFTAKWDSIRVAFDEVPLFDPQELEAALDGEAGALASAEPDYIGPFQPSQWIRRFDISLATFARMRKPGGGIRSRQETTKRIWIHPDDVARLEKKSR